MTPEALAWHDGQWGDSHNLHLPLSDRGLQLADGLFETVLILHGKAQLLPAHLQRWHQSAALLGMATPPDQAVLDPLIDDAIERVNLNLGNSAGALRLNWSRGSVAGRGIGLPQEPPDATQHRFWLTLQPHQLCFSLAKAWICTQEQRNDRSLLSRCKTLAYGQSIQARREAQRHGAELALLRNTRGDLCCGDSANLLVLREGEWITPPLSSGCLPGVMRAQLLQRGLAREATLGAELQSGDQALLINSLGCRALQAVNGQAMTADLPAETLWRQLISS
ncbi:aminotransferase class IV [Synechococcus sp. NOUM97013]|uniref:aminotransferase class IV n=1 Tax=Synechococcus sp. NOUM97013 TaxID=1442555 RepID=UPI0016480D2D|nr:aminotransferase class IV [Synechococcus sp. NOUM97013]QNI74918.1 4-amino-4-deoxychorismate lyase [Synechococcus sp. NOUM97013]